MIPDRYPLPAFLRRPVVALRERPILFSAPMVRALLESEKANDVKLITERTKVREVAARWAKQYTPHGPYGRDQEKQEITKALSVLDAEAATASDVAAIIGNNSWCGPSTCNECGAVVAVAVQVGEEPGYESRTATLCFSCVEKALALIGPNVEFSGQAASPQASLI